MHVAKYEEGEEEENRAASAFKTNRDATFDRWIFGEPKPNDNEIPIDRMTTTKKCRCVAWNVAMMDVEDPSVVLDVSERLIR